MDLFLTRLGFKDDTCLRPALIYISLFCSLCAYVSPPCSSPMWLCNTFLHFRHFQHFQHSTFALETLSRSSPPHRSEQLTEKSWEGWPRAVIQGHERATPPVSVPGRVKWLVGGSATRTANRWAVSWFPCARPWLMSLNPVSHTHMSWWGQGRSSWLGSECWGAQEWW